MYALDDGEDLGQARVRRVEVLSQSCEMSRVKELTFRNSVFSQQKLTKDILRSKNFSDSFQKGIFKIVKSVKIVKIVKIGKSDTN